MRFGPLFGVWAPPRFTIDAIYPHMNLVLQILVCLADPGWRFARLKAQTVCFAVVRKHLRTKVQIEQHSSCSQIGTATNKHTSTAYSYKDTLH